MPAPIGEPTVAIADPQPDELLEPAVELAPEVELEDPLEAEEEEEEEEEEPENATLTAAERAQTADPLKLYVRQLGDGRLLTPAEERELARRKDEGDEAAK